MEVAMDAVFDTIEEVVLAAQGLREVSKTIEELTDLACSNRRTTVSLTEAEAAAVKDVFTCTCLHSCFLNQICRSNGFIMLP